MVEQQEACKIDKAALTEAACGTAHEPHRAKRHKRRRDWDLLNMRSVTTRLGVKEYEQLCRVCDAQRVSQYQLVRELVLVYMQAAIRNGALRGGDAK